MNLNKTNKVLNAYLDQVAAYVRDIKGYHKSSEDKNVKAVLILTETKEMLMSIGEVTVCLPDRIGDVIDSLTGNGIDYDPDIWINSLYETLPTLVQAAKKIFQKEPLPTIKRANSSGIPKALNILKEISKKAEENQERVLILVTGVPGSGKTLLGLHFVYECFDNKNTTVFLSGNDPLVKVLQHELKSDSNVFVKPLRKYIDYYKIKKRETPKEHIVVFDEAQRAWNLERVFRT